jgi:hypothetical protein
VGRQNFETFTRLFPLEGFTFVSPLPWFPDWKFFFTSPSQPLTQYTVPTASSFN